MSNIDVSKCEYYKMARCPEGYSCKYYCCNCYYKQLQQLKAENELLKEKYDTLKSDNLDTIQELDNIRRRNEKLEQFNNTLNEIEEICKTTICDYPMNKVEEIMKLIKEVKDDE